MTEPCARNLINEFDPNTAPQQPPKDVSSFASDFHEAAGALAVWDRRPVVV
jgi:hypothetical protein